MFIDFQSLVMQNIFTYLHLLLTLNINVANLILHIEREMSTYSNFRKLHALMNFGK